jgi:hypothetical protein
MEPVESYGLVELEGKHVEAIYRTSEYTSIYIIFAGIGESVRVQDYVTGTVIPFMVSSSRESYKRGFY